MRLPSALHGKAYPKEINLGAWRIWLQFASVAKGLRGVGAESLGVTGCTAGLGLGVATAFCCPVLPPTLFTNRWAHLLLVHQPGKVGCF